MPGWLVLALQLLGLELGAETLTGGEGVIPGRQLQQITSLGPGKVAARLFGAAEKPARRRRRRALTASDRADIAFITGLLGPTAGKNFALTVATRTA